MSKTVDTPVYSYMMATKEKVMYESAEALPLVSTEREVPVTGEGQVTYPIEAGERLRPLNFNDIFSVFSLEESHLIERAERMDFCLSISSIPSKHPIRMYIRHVIAYFKEQKGSYPEEWDKTGLDSSSKVSALAHNLLYAGRVALTFYLFPALSKLPFSMEWEGTRSLEKIVESIPNEHRANAYQELSDLRNMKTPAKRVREIVLGTSDKKVMKSLTETLNPNSTVAAYHGLNRLFDDKKIVRSLWERWVDVLSKHDFYSNRRVEHHTRELNIGDEVLGVKMNVSLGHKFSTYGMHINLMPDVLREEGLVHYLYKYTHESDNISEDKLKNELLRHMDNEEKKIVSPDWDHKPSFFSYYEWLMSNHGLMQRMAEEKDKPVPVYTADDRYRQYSSIRAAIARDKKILEGNLVEFNDLYKKTDTFGFQRSVGNLTFKIPDSNAELSYFGGVLSNCLGGMTDNILEDNARVIAFSRKEDPDKLIGAMEMKYDTDGYEVAFRSILGPNNDPITTKLTNDECFYLYSYTRDIAKERDMKFRRRSGDMGGVANFAQESKLWSENVTISKDLSKGVEGLVHDLCNFFNTQEDHFNAAYIFGSDLEISGQQTLLADTVLDKVENEIVCHSNKEDGKEYAPLFDQDLKVWMKDLRGLVAKVEIVTDDADNKKPRVTSVNRLPEVYHMSLGYGPIDGPRQTRMYFLSVIMKEVLRTIFSKGYFLAKITRDGSTMEEQLKRLVSVLFGMNVNVIQEDANPYYIESLTEKVTDNTTNVVIKTKLPHLQQEGPAKVFNIQMRKDIEENEPGDIMDQFNRATYRKWREIKKEEEKERKQKAQRISSSVAQGVQSVTITAVQQHHGATVERNEPEPERRHRFQGHGGIQTGTVRFDDVASWITPDAFPTRDRPREGETEDNEDEEENEDFEDEEDDEESTDEPVQFTGLQDLIERNYIGHPRTHTPREPTFYESSSHLVDRICQELHMPVNEEDRRQVGYGPRMLHRLINTGHVVAEVDREIANRVYRITVHFNSVRSNEALALRTIVPESFIQRANGIRNVETEAPELETFTEATRGTLRDEERIREQLNQINRGLPRGIV